MANTLSCNGLLSVAAAVCAGNLLGAGLAWDFDAGTLTEAAKPGEKPWVFAYTSDGVLGCPVQKGDAKTLDFRHLPDGVPPLKELGRNCLSGTAIEEVYLPDTLVSIGPAAFHNCRKLRRIEPLIPDSVTHFGTSHALGGCGALEGTLVIGGSDGPIDPLPGDNRFLLSGLGRIGGLVFGAGCGPSFFKWSYGGFNGCGSVTSIVCRTKETLDWSQGVSWPEGCRTCLFQDMKKLATVDVAGFVSNGAGLPELKPGQCTIRVPAESAEWKDFLAQKTNVVDALTVKGNALGIPAGYRIEVKPPVAHVQSWGYAPKLVELTVDPDAKPIRDASESSAFPIMGFAGSLAADGEYSKYFYEDHRKETARVFRRAGVRLVRQWGANDQWQLGAGCGRSWRKKPGYNYEEYRTDMKNVFSFYKEYGIRAFLSLENYSVYVDPYNGVKTNDLATVKKVICDYVKWIVDNGFTECVAGFELGNEPYFMGYNMHKPGAMTPEQYAARWTEIVKGIVEIWPKAPIGIALAEYMKGDCDFKAVRARMLAEKKIEPKSYFDESAANQWSGRYVVAMSNALPHISHVIYHAYGGAIPESCSYCGIARFRCFTGAFPELKGKKFWITEWRERSDEDNRSHQRFHETLFKAGYMTMMIAQPDVDGLSLHQFNSLSGALYLSGAAPKSAPNWHSRSPSWFVSWDSSNSTRPNLTSDNDPEIQVGISGPVFRLYNEALLTHPLVMDFGETKNGFQSQGCTNAIWVASQNYSSRKSANCQVLVTMNKSKSSIALLAVNTRSVPAKLVLRPTAKYRLCGPDYRVYSCPEEFLYRHELPGEGKFTKLYGYEEYPAPKDPYTVEIPANSVTTVTIPVRRK